MIIDTHVHVWEIDPPKYPVGPTAPNWNSYPDEPGTADELLAEMDTHGVDLTVLVQTSWSTWDNGYIADSVARFPGRFIGHGLIDPLASDNADLVRYWMAERGLAGFRFHPMYYTEEPVLVRPQNQPMWEEIASRGAVIQLHMRAAQAAQVGQIAGEWPGVTLIIDHMGYPDLAEDEAAYAPILDLATHDNVYAKVSDVAGRSAEGFPYGDVQPRIRALVSAFGAQRMIWGTGYPGHHRTKHNWPALADELRLIREGIPFLSANDIDCLLGDTARAIWGL
jgi:L-fuconolactonase